MNFNTIAIYSLLAASSGADAAFLRSGAGLGVGGGCQEGQIYVVNNCGASTTLKRDTVTIQEGCFSMTDFPIVGHRICVVSDDKSTCNDNGITLFEYTYNSTASELFWDVSLLSGYNYPVKVDGGETPLDVTGPSCGSVIGGLYPCAQPDNACAKGSTKWPDHCEGCTHSCCDMTDKDHDCSQPAIFSTQNMVLTFCPNQESFSLDADTFIESESNTLELKRTALDRVKSEGVYLASDAAATLDVTVTANVDALPKCVNEDHPVTVFYTKDDKKDLSPYETFTHTIAQDGDEFHFGIQVNDWYWRSSQDSSSKQWADNAGMEVIIKIKDASTCDFELKPSWHDSNAPDARDVLDLTKTSESGGCSFTVARKADPSLHITKDCVGPCIPNPTKYQLPWQPGCDCTTGGSTVNCPTEN
jgi:hypothetical protein